MVHVLLLFAQKVRRHLRMASSFAQQPNTASVRFQLKAVHTECAVHQGDRRTALRE